MLYKWQSATKMQLIIKSWQFHCYCEVLLPVRTSYSQSFNYFSKLKGFLSHIHILSSCEVKALSGFIWGIFQCGWGGAARVENRKAPLIRRAIPVGIPHSKWTPDTEKLSSHRRYTEVAIVFTKKGSVSLNLHTCIINISQSWLASEKSELMHFEVIWWYTLSFELVDDRWILVSLLENLKGRDTNVHNIFQGMLRRFWPEDHLRRWYSMWDSLHYQPATSLSCNLEEPNSYQKETSLSEILLSKILLKWEFSNCSKIWEYRMTIGG